MAWIGFFYLLRPGEYCKINENKPIQLKHITLLLGHRKLDALNDPIEDIRRATHSSITFDDQKNREKGEVIGHGTSGIQRHAQQARALVVRRAEQLRQQKGTPNTALCAVRDGNKWKHVTSAMVTAHLHTAAATIPHLNYMPEDVSARSLRAGGAMALFCGKVHQQTIQLVGRWKSAAIFRYLHAQALPLVHNLAA